MEVNKVNGDIVGVVATDNILDGKMIFLTTHSQSANFGSLTDLPGAGLPATEEQAKRARFVATWARDNRSTPLFIPAPAYPWALRMGWEQAGNTPFSATVHVTHPAYKKSQIIPSGVSMVAYGAGTFTVPSGTYIYNASLVKGALLSVSYASTTRGMLQYAAAYGDTVVAIVEELDASTKDLTFKTGQF